MAEGSEKYRRKKHNMFIPLILVFIFVVVMAVFTSRLMYSVAVSNSSAVIEDRMLNISSMIENHLNTAENVLHVTADSIYHMLISGSTPARIHEFLVEETNNVAEQFDENYTGLYGYIMSRYMDGLNWEPPEGYDPKTRDWYIKAKEGNGDVVFVPPYIDAQTGNMIISICRMLPDKQNIISLDVQLKGVQSMMNELTLNGKGYGFVVDEDGLIVAHRDEAKKGMNICDTPEGKEYLEAIKSGGFGSFSYTCDGQKSTVFVNSIMNRWYVVMVVSDLELYREVRNQLVANVIICTVVFLLIAGFYYASYRNEQKYTKRMEEMKLEEQKASYERKVLELEKDAANASNKAKSVFLANMSHEIRTPMNAIIGMDEMILRKEKDSEIRKYAMDIQSACKTLLSIINDILDFSKIESGKMELVESDYQISSVINDIMNMTRKKAEKKGLKYELEVSHNIPTVFHGDETRIRQVLLNLINNAIKYTHEGGVFINISFDHEKSALKFMVRDTGIGIRPSDMNKLFESFQRLEEDRNKNIEGTGLGLNISRQLAEMMNGSIEVRSEYGMGSTFTAILVQKVTDATPIGDYVENIARMQDQREDYRPALYAPKARILVVDDNEMNLEVIEGLLHDTGIKITTAESGRDCIKILKDTEFDLIFLDQMMPGLSGVQTLSAIREQHLADDVPVIALTADAIVSARDSYIREGFSDYLSKPVIYEDLENMLRKYIPQRLQEELPETPATDNGSAPDTARAVEKPGAPLPTMLVINDSLEALRSLKEILADSFKAVYVRDEKSAEKYLSKHEVEYILTQSLLPLGEGGASAPDEGPEA